MFATVLSCGLCLSFRRFLFILQEFGILDENERIEDQTLFDIIFKNSKFIFENATIITGGAIKLMIDWTSNWLKF